MSEFLPTSFKLSNINSSLFLQKGFLMFFQYQIKPGLGCFYTERETKKPKAVQGRQKHYSRKRFYKVFMENEYKQSAVSIFQG